MDCREAQAVLSALFDGEDVTPEERAAAEGHCPSCDECAAFRVALEALAATPAPTPGSGLADRVLLAVAEAREADREAEAISAAAAIAEAARPANPIAPALKEQTWAPSWLDRRMLWTLTGSIASVAAIVSALVLYNAGAFSGLSGRSVDELTRVPTAPESAATMGAPAADAASGGAMAATAPAAKAVAPRYLVFANRVYLMGAAIDASSSTLTTLGTTTAVFEGAPTPVTATVYRSPLGDGSLLARAGSVSVQCAPVTRTLGNARFHLTAAGPVTRYGDWPRMPSGLAEPIREDGAPTFVPAGTDAAGVPVFARPGQQPASGLAVGPGTDSGDPAGGNPFWTWWLPFRAP